ncbi:MAG: M48 family metalloprotease, partial [Acidobacteriaceae bacterium]
AAGLANLAAQFGLGSYFLKNSRTAESQADLLGTDIMYDAGYNPQGLADFFVKLQQMGGGQGPQFLSDHPDPGNRQEGVQRELSKLGDKRFQPDSPEFLHIKQIVGTLQHPGNGLPAGSTQPQRYTGPGSAQPSGSMATLDHQMYSVSYPSSWQVYGDRQSDVTIAPQGGIARGANGQTEVAYGVILSVFEGERRTDNPLEDGTHQLEDQLRQGNPDLRQAGNEESVRVNGILGRSLEFTSRSPVEGQRERDWLVTLERPNGGVAYLVFIAPERDYGSLRPVFEQILQSYHIR